MAGLHAATVTVTLRPTVLLQALKDELLKMEQHERNHFKIEMDKVLASVGT